MSTQKGMRKGSFQRTMPSTPSQSIAPQTPTRMEQFVRSLIVANLSPTQLDWRRAPEDGAKIDKATFAERLERIERFSVYSGTCGVPKVFNYRGSDGRPVEVPTWEHAKGTMPKDRAALLASIQVIETERLFTTLLYGKDSSRHVPDNLLSSDMVLLGNAFYRLLNGLDGFQEAVDYLIRKIKGQVSGASIPLTQSFGSGDPRSVIDQGRGPKLLRERDQDILTGNSQSPHPQAQRGHLPRSSKKEQVWDGGDEE